MSNVNHRTCFEKLLPCFRGALRLKHIIGILGLTEHIHKSSVEGIGMIAALMVKRMPQTTSYMLSGRAIECIVTGVRIGRSRIMLGLNQHGMLTPIAGHTTWRIVRVPVVHIVSPFARKIGDVGVQFRHGPFLVGIRRMTELHGVYFMATGLMVAT